MKKLSSLALLLLAACVASEPVAPGAPYRLSGSEIATVKAEVRQVMKDPDSARFGQIAAAQAADGTITVCGWVNGKNSFGAYTGELPFLGIYSPGTGRFLVGDISDASSAPASVQVCRNRGVGI